MIWSYTFVNIFNLWLSKDDGPAILAGSCKIVKKQEIGLGWLFSWDLMGLVQSILEGVQAQVFS